MDCIVLDQGNTSVKWGFFQDGKILSSGRISDDKLDDELTKLRSEFNVPYFYSSVRSNHEQEAFLNRFGYCQLIPDIKFPKYHYSEGVAGRDRLANIAGASDLYLSNAILVVDFGTCITYSLGKNKELISGAISLGAQSRLRAMHEFTGQLPKLGFRPVELPFQNSTSGAMLSSAYFGIVSELNGYIEFALKEMPDLTVVFTGTDAEHFAKQLNYRIFVELNLTLIGLYAISRANEY